MGRTIRCGEARPGVQGSAAWGMSNREGIPILLVVGHSAEVRGVIIIKELRPPASSDQRPLFSIVTVTLNAGAALVRTAASVARQTFADFEHVVKDGGSSDGSLAPLQGFPKVRLVCAPDHGIYYAMSQALRVCCGKYVLFLNAGDLFAWPGALAAVAERAARCDADLLYCDLAGSPAPVTYPDRLSRFFLYRSVLCHQTCFFKKSVFERLGDFDHRFRIAADHEFLLRALLDYRLSYEHIGIAATVYERGGFSEAKTHRRLLAQEQREVRRRFFTLSQRVRFSAALAMTLQPLRVAILRSPRFRGVAPLYQRTVNAWNRLGAKPGGV